MKYRLSFFAPVLLLAATFGCATVASPEESLSSGGLPDVGGGGAGPTGSGGSSALVGSGTGGADSSTGGSDGSSSGGGDAMGSGGNTAGGAACAAGCKAWSEFGHHTPPPPAVGACIAGADGSNYTYDGNDGTGTVYSEACGPSAGEREMWCEDIHSKFSPCN